MSASRTEEFVQRTLSALFCARRYLTPVLLAVDSTATAKQKRTLETHAHSLRESYEAIWKILRELKMAKRRIRADETKPNVFAVASEEMCGAECSAVRERTGAKLVALVVVFSGAEEDFDFAIDGAPECVALLPELLHDMASRTEKCK